MTEESLDSLADRYIAIVQECHRVSDRFKMQHRLEERRGLVALMSKHGAEKRDRAIMAAMERTRNAAP